MFPLLDTVRAGEIAPDRLLAGLPGSRIWYLDDGTPPDPAKAAWAPELRPAEAWRRQSLGCGVFCTLAAFAPPPAVGEVGPVLALCVDAELARPGEAPRPTGAEMDLRKEYYLDRYLLAFPLRPHWLVETRRGFQSVFRIAPAPTGAGSDDALGLCRALAVALLGDEGACGLVQHVRVPGWAQLDEPGSPFRCRLLLDLPRAPYGLDELRGTLRTWLSGPQGRALPPSRLHALPPAPRADA